MRRLNRSGRLRAAWLAALIAVFIAVPAGAQTNPPIQSPAQTQALAMVKVFVTCEGCDLAALKGDVAFVQHVTAAEEATVTVTIAQDKTDPNLRIWLLSFTGRETFAGQNRRLTLTLIPSAGAPDLRAGLARMMKFGLAEYAMRSDIASQLDVLMRPAPEDEAGAKPGGPTRDRWNYWVYNLSVNGYQSSEVSSSNGSFSGGASANRTTEAWKMRFGFYKSNSSSRFTVSDTLTTHTKQYNWSVDSLVVKSLGEHWSAGLTGDASSSTYSNQKLRASVNAAVEFDFFPYSQSSQRSLTVQYSAGPARYEYHELTIFDKMKETVWKHSVGVSLGLRQPWGSAGASFNFSQLLNSPDKNQLSVYGNINYRIFKGFSVNGSVGFSRIRDQFYLEKSGATPEEILLRLRQIATGYSYDANIGFSFSFGSLSNSTVNPRFGG